MNIWTAVLIFAIVMIVIERNKTVRGLRHNEPADDSHSAPPPVERRDTETQRELDDLRERIKVLERITVDGREAREIADEIEKLRDS